MEYIPTPTTEQTLLTVSPTLDGELFFITYDYNSILDSWTIKIQDVSGAKVVEGVRLVPNVLLLRNVNTDNRPEGEMFVFTIGGEDITGDNIEYCRVIYLPASDIV